MRPRTTNADTNTFGAQLPRTGTSITGDVRDTLRTKASSTPSRSTVTSTVASLNGRRSWKRAVSPGS